MSQETFERELARRAEDVRGAPISFEDVRGRAHAIRRRRRVAAAGAVAAAVALVVIVPSLLGGHAGKRSEGPDPAHPVPGHTAVLHDGTVTLPDGSAVDVGVETGDATQLGVLTDGRILLALQHPYVVRVIAPDGTRHADYPVAANVITLSARDDVAAWVGDDYRIRVLSAGAERPAVMHGVPMPGEGVGSIDAVLDAGHLLAGDFATTTHEITAEGAVPLRLSRPMRVDDVSPDGSLWAVSYPDDADPQFGCSGLYDPDADRLVAKNCATSGLRFAPGGEHLLGMRGDNNMAGSVEVFDLDLEQVGSFSPDPAVVSRAAWADADHLVVTTADWHDNQWSLVRVAVDGTDPQVLEGPDTGGNPETEVEYLLSE
jgi:hypothetical protein